MTTEITTLSGRPLGNRQIDVAPIPPDADQLVTHLADVVRRHIACVPRDGSIIGVGAAFPGFVADEVLRGADGFPWDGLPVEDWWMATLAEAGLSQVSVTVAGEAQLEAMHAVRTIERVSAQQSTLYVGGGSSINGAVIMNDQIQPGDHGTAGRLAHLPVGSGIWCGCGQRGCLDTVASLAAILAASHAGNAFPDTTPEQAQAIRWLLDQAAAGSSAVTAALETAGEALSVALRAACATLDPGSVIVGGHLGSLWASLPMTDFGGDFGVTVTHLDAGAADPVSGGILAAQDTCLAEPLVWTNPDVAEAATTGPGGREQQHPVTYPRAEIVKIAVDRAGSRSAVVRNPSDPHRPLRHGLGEVGQPIAPYLGHRVGHGDDGGYEVVLPENRGSLYVYQTDPRGRGGAGIERRLPWAAIGAPDLPNQHALSTPAR